MITFTGQLLHISTIKTSNKNNTPNNRVSLYKLNPQSPHDNIIVEDLVNLWSENDTVIRAIKDNFKYNKHNINEKTTEEFYILANKHPKDTIIQAKNVLAITQTSSINPKNGVEIDFFQTIPKKLRSKTQEISNLKNIGNKMLNELKNIFYGKKLWLYSSNKTINFYIKNGFKQIGISKAGLPIMKF